MFDCVLSFMSNRQLDNTEIGPRKSNGRTGEVQDGTHNPGLQIKFLDHYTTESFKEIMVYCAFALSCTSFNLEKID